MSDQPGAEPDAVPAPEPDMQAEVPEEGPDGSQADAHAEAARKRRLDEVFGSGEHHDGGKGDSWYRDQIPPHHG